MEQFVFELEHRRINFLKLDDFILLLSCFVRGDLPPEKYYGDFIRVCDK